MYYFGLVSTLILFLIFNKLKNNKYISKIPIIISVGVVLIIILKLFKIDYQTYYQSAKYLSAFIAPATIALAYPMYKNSTILIKNKRALYGAIFVGVFVAIISTYFCAKFFKSGFSVIMSLMPKSTTMPIAIEISKSIGGISELTACIVAITGIFGGVFGFSILKFLRVKSQTALGLALGCASHVIGTASCAEKKMYKATAASTISLILTGLLSAIIIPMLKSMF